MNTLKNPISKTIAIILTITFFTTSTNLNLVFAADDGLTTPMPTDQGSTTLMTTGYPTSQPQSASVSYQSAVDNQDATLAMETLGGSMMTSTDYMEQGLVTIANVSPEITGVMVTAESTEQARQNAITGIQNTFTDPSTMGTVTTTSTNTTTGLRTVTTYMSAADKTNKKYDTSSVYNISDGSLVSRTRYTYYDGTSLVSTKSVYTAVDNLVKVYEYENASTKRQIGSSVYRSSADFSSSTAVSVTGYLYTQTGTKKTSYALVYNAEGTATTSAKYYTYYSDGYTQYYYVITNSSTPKKLYLYRDKAGSLYKEYYEFRWDDGDTCKKAQTYKEVEAGNKLDTVYTYDTTGTVWIQKDEYLEYYSNGKTKDKVTEKRDSSGNPTYRYEYSYYDNGYLKTQKTVTYQNVDGVTSEKSVSKSFYDQNTSSRVLHTQSIVANAGWDKVSKDTYYDYSTGSRKTAYIESAFTYYSGTNNLKSKQTAYYDISTQKVTSIVVNQYKDSSTISELTVSTEYRVTATGTRGTRSKETTAFVYVGIPPAQKPAEIFTYDTTGNVIVDKNSYTYYADTGNLQSHKTYAPNGDILSSKEYANDGVNLIKEETWQYHAQGVPSLHVVVEGDLRKESAFDAGGLQEYYREYSVSSNKLLELDIYESGSIKCEMAYDYFEGTGNIRSCRINDYSGTASYEQYGETFDLNGEAKVYIYEEYQDQSETMLAKETWYKFSGTEPKKIFSAAYESTGEILLSTYHDNANLKSEKFYDANGDALEYKIYGDDGVTVLKDESWYYTSPGVVNMHVVIDFGTDTTTEEVLSADGSRTVTITNATLKTVSVYGPIGLMTSHREYSMPGEALTLERIYYTDAYGRLQSQTDSNGTYNYYNDATNRLQSKIDSTGTTTYYNDAANLPESKTLNTVDGSGMIYYHYLNENWASQGFGRVDKAKRATALNGELSYTYSYYADGNGRLQTKRSYSDVNYTTLVATYTYNNDTTNRLQSKAIAATGTNYMYEYYTSGNTKKTKEYNSASKLVKEEEYYDAVNAPIKNITLYQYYPEGYIIKEANDYYLSGVVQKESVYYEIPNVVSLPLREIFHNDVTAYINKRIDYDYYNSGALHTLLTSDYLAGLKTYVSYADTGFGKLGPAISSYSWRLWKGIDSQVKTFGADLSVRPAGADDQWQPYEAWLMTVNGYIMEYVNVLETGT